MSMMTMKLRIITVAVILVIVMVWLLMWNIRPPVPVENPPPNPAPAAPAPANPDTSENSPPPVMPFGAEPIVVEGIENLFRVTPTIYSGGQPEGDAAFKRLQELGVKTVLSVDGGKPDVETAHKYGMRYVHLPIGYDGVPAEQSAKIVQVVRQLPQPLYIHCHHGKHRGPAAVAIACIADANWSPAFAENWLEQAGTSPDYPGLFASVAEFKAPAESPPATAEDLPETAAVGSLVEAMVKVDITWDQLKSTQKNKFAVDPKHPDIVPDRTALQLAEIFKELLRTEAADAHPAEFTAHLQEAADASSELHQVLMAGKLDEAETAFNRVKKSCTTCHVQFRDPAESGT